MSLKSDGLDDPKWERDISLITSRYFKNNAIIDILANIPLMIYYFKDDFTHEEMDFTGAYDLFFFAQLCKILRLFHIGIVFDSIRFLFDKIGDIFY